MGAENFNRSGATGVNIMREVEGSLHRRQTDYVDLYQVHGPDSNTPLEETLRRSTISCVKGKSAISGSPTTWHGRRLPQSCLQERLGLETHDMAQMYYSLVGRGLEYEFQSFADYHNIAVPVSSPLAGAFLTGKYSRANAAPAGTRFAEAGAFVPFDKEMGFRVVEVLKQAACSPSRKPGPCGALVGAGRPAVSMYRRRSEARATGG